MLKTKSRMVIALLIMCMSLPTIIYAAGSVSQEAVVWMLITPGSRSGGMGEAFVAQTDDSYATYWNQGAMAFNRKTQIAGMHTNWLQGSGVNDIYAEFLSWNNYYPEIGNIGFNIHFMNLGTQEQTDEDGNELGTFSSYALAASFVYGYQVSESWGVGTSFKFIYDKLAENGTGNTETDTKGVGKTFAFDLSAKCKNILYGISDNNDFIGDLAWGINIQNIGPNISYVDNAQSDPLPMNVRTGLSYHALNDEFSNLFVNFDVNKVFANDDSVFERFISDIDDNNYIYNFGTEYTYIDLISLRLGYVYDEAGSIQGTSFGTGIKYVFNEEYKVSADFALQPAGDLTDYNKTFSLSLEF